MSSVLDTLATGATITERRVDIYLNGALQAQLDQIAAGFEDALELDRKHGSAEDPTPAYDALAQHHEDVRRQMLASRVTFVFRGLPWQKQVALQAAHRPRANNLVDSIRGYNYETYLPALIRASIHEVIGHDGDTQPGAAVPDDTWDNLFGAPEVTREDATEEQPERDGVEASLNSAQMDDLTNAAINVNHRSPAVPPSALSLRQRQDSGKSSTSSSPGTSPRAGSTAGSRPTSPTSSDGPTTTPETEPAPRDSSERSDDS